MILTDWFGWRLKEMIHILNLSVLKGKTTHPFSWMWGFRNLIRERMMIHCVISAVCGSHSDLKKKHRSVCLTQHMKLGHSQNNPHKSALVCFLFHDFLFSSACCMPYTHMIIGTLHVFLMWRHRVHHTAVHRATEDAQQSSGVSAAMHYCQWKDYHYIYYSVCAELFNWSVAPKKFFISPWKRLLVLIWRESMPSRNKCETKRMQMLLPID